ncbi:MAG: thio(seleno)oxazole modification radical SAM maturase SbtM [Thermodesulfovibrionales bacterium]|nr:thio(seleno)oxazole modification radical SAM maturase SbtM [Thermodesulfovibrionales bacterium]
MRTFQAEEHTEPYTACRSIAGPELWARLSSDRKLSYDSEPLIGDLIRAGGQGMPKFLPDLARLEYTIEDVRRSEVRILEVTAEICLNPTVRLLDLSWKNLLPLLTQDRTEVHADPVPGSELVLVWNDPARQRVKYRVASQNDLLALKITDEHINPESAAKEGNVTVGMIDSIIDEAVHEGILLSPPSQLNRDQSIFPLNDYVDKSFLSSHSFTLQWHITQACDLHCRHCYDRSSRSPMSLEQGIRILDDVRMFCRNRHVIKAVSFTGGNPFLYPHFAELYRAASERGFSIGILGNPTGREKIESLIAIQKPTHFQVSLEGLQAQNDFIRGEGHFDRVMEFLKVLRELNIFSMVMLTLTKNNMKEVIPLAEILNEHADRFHFNRLSMVGEGASLMLPEKEKYIAFLDSYEKAVQKYPVLGLKDNMLSVLSYKKGLEPFGGCTTFGCGAAFNFLAVLSDGEVHACRKFPSPIGNIFRQSISDIYDSPQAQRYREGCRACRTCKLHAVCGGCLAVAHSLGQDIYEEKDPFCFLNE